MFLQSEDSKPLLLTSLQCSPCRLTEFSPALSSWVELWVLCLGLFPNLFAYWASVYPLDPDLNVMALSPCLNLVGSLCILL